jgi:hypothetical protein
MKFFPFSRNPAKKKPAKPTARGKKSELAEQLDLAVRSKKEMDRKVAEIQRQIDDIPKQIKKREELEKQRIKKLAASTPTIRDPSLSFQRLHVLSSGARRTRVEQRIMLNRFLILCAVLGLMLFFLWKAAR